MYRAAHAASNAHQNGQHFGMLMLLEYAELDEESLCS